MSVYIRIRDVLGRVGIERLTLAVHTAHAAAFWEKTGLPTVSAATRRAVAHRGAAARRQGDGGTPENAGAHTA